MNKSYISYFTSVEQKDLVPEQCVSYLIYIAFQGWFSDLILCDAFSAYISANSFHFKQSLRIPWGTP